MAITITGESGGVITVTRPCRLTMREPSVVSEVMCSGKFSPDVRVVPGECLVFHLFFGRLICLVEPANAQLTTQPLRLLKS